MKHAKRRKIPKVFTSSPHDRFNMMGEVELKFDAVSIHREQGPGGGKPYTDAELKLLIAHMERAKEVIVDKIDHHITMIQAILNGEE